MSSRRLKVFLVALLTAGALVAQTPTYEKILLPVVANEPLHGAFGSSWTTDIWVLNMGPGLLGVGGIAWTCFLPECADPAALTPGVTFRPRVLDPEEGLQGTFVHPVAGLSDRLSFGLRFRDTSRPSQTWGTELPAVREAAFRSDKVSLIDIPLTAGFRQVLRIYELDGEEREALVRVRMYRLRLENREPNGTPDQLLGQAVVGLRFPPIRPDAHPGYAAVSDLSTIAPLGNAERVRLEIEPVTPGLRLWAFVTIVNNETQHATVITPQ